MVIEVRGANHDHHRCDVFALGARRLYSAAKRRKTCVKYSHTFRIYPRPPPCRRRWRPPLWEYPSTEVLDFSNLLVPTMDSTRALFLLRMLHKQRKAVLMVGAEGTAKTSTALMFFTELDPVKTAVKRCAGNTSQLSWHTHTNKLRRPCGSYCSA